MLRLAFWPPVGYAATRKPLPVAESMFAFLMPLHEKFYAKAFDRARSYVLEIRLLNDSTFPAMSIPSQFSWDEGGTAWKTKPLNFASVASP